MDGSPDVIVVGLGAAGSATLLALAQRGIRCAGIDRFEPPHDQGSSHGRSRLIRLCYFEHPDYVPLLHKSYERWHELQACTPMPVFRMTGGVYIGTSRDPFVRGSLHSARTHGLAHEVLAADAASSRFPQFAIRAEEQAFFEPTTGVLFPENAIAATLSQARELGARTYTNESVTHWSAADRSVEVHTSKRVLSAASVVLCAGAWMPKLVLELKPVLTVTRQVLAWFRSSGSRLFHAPQMPAWAISEPDGSAHYGFPMFDPESSGQTPPGGDGFKVALHKLGDPSDPDAVDRRVRDEEIASLATFLESRIPGAISTDRKLLDAKVCLYTSTPDQHFLIDRHPEHENVIVVSACSGHGFKLSPAMGLAAADLATRGTTALPIQFLRWRSGTA